MTTKLGHKCIYRLDAYDLLADADKAFYVFALENASPELSKDRIIGRSIWEFLSGVDVRALYEILFQRVRAGATIEHLRFRCDTPDLRRFMELTLRPLPEREIEVESVLIREEPRDWIRLLDVAAPRGDDSVILCGLCKRVQLDENRWAEVEDAVREKNLFAPIAMPALSYTVCPDCNRRALASSD